MRFPRRCILLAVILFAIVRIDVFSATDPDVERLLKKLPPPEKLVHADERILRVNDPAINDPLVKQILAASKANQIKRGLDLSQQLTKHFPSSVLANCFVGYFQLELRRDGDASTAFRKALAIQPHFVLAHFYLGMAEWHQGHVRAALPHFREITKLEPRAAGGWAALSMAAEDSGERMEALSAARKLVELAPQHPAAWVRLALAEQNVGNSGAAVQAWNKAVALERAMHGSDKKPGKKKKE